MGKPDHPGKPPSMRNGQSTPGRPSDWREITRGYVGGLVHLTWSADPSMKIADVCEAVESNVGDALSDMPIESWLIVKDGRELVGSSALFRMAMDRSGIDYKDPVVAESILAVAQQALAELLAESTG